MLIKEPDEHRLPVISQLKQPKVEITCSSKRFEFCTPTEIKQKLPRFQRSTILKQLKNLQPNNIKDATVLKCINEYYMKHIPKGEYDLANKTWSSNELIELTKYCSALQASQGTDGYIPFGVLSLILNFGRNGDSLKRKWKEGNDCYKGKNPPLDVFVRLIPTVVDWALKEVKGKKVKIEQIIEYPTKIPKRQKRSEKLIKIANQVKSRCSSSSPTLPYGGILHGPTMNVVPSPKKVMTIERAHNIIQAAANQIMERVIQNVGVRTQIYSNLQSSPTMVKKEGTAIQKPLQVQPKIKPIKKHHALTTSPKLSPKRDNLASPKSEYLASPKPASVSSPKSEEAFKRKRVPDWSVDDVCDFLRSIGLQEYISQFQKEKIDGEVLLDLKLEDWKQYLQIPLGHQKKIQQCYKYYL